MAWHQQVANHLPEATLTQFTYIYLALGEHELTKLPLGDVNIILQMYFSNSLNQLIS